MSRYNRAPDFPARLWPELTNEPVSYERIAEDNAYLAILAQARRKLNLIRQKMTA